MSVRRAAAVGLVLLVAGCGLPGDTEVRAVDATSVPYNLLDPEAQSRPGQVGPVTAGTPVVFWLVHDDRLAPTAAAVSCTDPVDEVVAEQLAVLAAAPDDAARSSGRSSTIPTSSELELVDVSDDVALVEFDPATSLTADRLPLAMGQLVLTVTSAPGIEAVQVSAAGDTIEVPLPGGALTDRPVTADDYAVFLPERFLGTGRRGLSTSIGCPTAGRWKPLAGRCCRSWCHRPGVDDHPLPGRRAGLEAPGDGNGVHDPRRRSRRVLVHRARRRVLCALPLHVDPDVIRVCPPEVDTHRAGPEPGGVGKRGARHQAQVLHDARGEGAVAPPTADELSGVVLALAVAGEVEAGHAGRAAPQAWRKSGTGHRPTPPSASERLNPVLLNVVVPC